MDHYRHPDLNVRLKNPNEARIFLDDPNTWLPHKKAQFIHLWSGRRIELDTQSMSDELVVEAAFVVLDDLVERAMLEDPPFPRFAQ